MSAWTGSQRFGKGVGRVENRRIDRDGHNYCSIEIGQNTVWFYGISTIVGYLMLNPLYTYILNISDLVGLG